MTYRILLTASFLFVLWYLCWPEPPIQAQVSAGIEEAAKQLVKEQFYHE